MIRGLYTAASGMQTMERRQETLANNLANINTPGYKQDDGVIRSFPEQLLSRIRDSGGMDIQGWPHFSGQPVPIGRLNTGVYMSEAIANFRQGDIEQTNLPFDVALADNLPTDPENAAIVAGKPVQPRLFFSVARLETADQLEDVPPENIRYTRNGNWMVNEQGYLVTTDGYYVLDQQNRTIRVNGFLDAAGNLTNVGDKLKITEAGLLLRPDPEGGEGAYVPLNPADDPENPVSIGLKVVNNPYQLEREGNNVFRWEGEGQPADVGPDQQGYYSIRQGWVERANVDPVRTMTDMMAVLRLYEANQRVITTVDATMDKAVNEIGRVNG